MLARHGKKPSADGLRWYAQIYSGYGEGADPSAPDPTQLKPRGPGEAPPPARGKAKRIRGAFGGFRPREDGADADPGSEATEAPPSDEPL